MELFTILLSVLLGIVSPVGYAADTLAEKAIRDRLVDAETLEVRIDNAPTYQFLQGEVNRVRIAGRGLYPVANVRVDTLEVETDPIDVNLAELRDGNLDLERPLQGAFRLVLTREDLNQALESVAIATYLRDLSLGAFGEDTVGGLQRADIVNPTIEFLEGDRIRIQATLREQGTGEELPIRVEFGVAVANGSRLQITEPEVVTDEFEFPPEILEPVIQGFTEQFTLRNLEEAGITARVLQLEVGPDALELAAFIRVEPSATLFE